MPHQISEQNTGTNQSDGSDSESENSNIRGLTPMTSAFDSQFTPAKNIQITDFSMAVAIPTELTHQKLDHQE